MYNFTDKRSTAILDEFLRKIIKYDDLNSYGDADEFDKEQATILAMNSDPIGERDIIPESDKFEDIMMSLKDFIMSHDVDDAVDLANKMKDAAVKYYAKALDERYDLVRTDMVEDVKYMAKFG